MSSFAAIRPSDWEFPLFLHVLGAMVLVGSLVLAIAYLVPAWRGGSVQMLSAGFRSLLWAALPSFIVMRVAAEWIADKEGYTGDDVPDWIDMGYMIGDPGLLLLLISIVVAGVAVRRARGGEGELAGGGVGIRVATVLVSILLVALVFAIWGMTAKPD